MNAVSGAADGWARGAAGVLQKNQAVVPTTANPITAADLHRRPPSGTDVPVAGGSRTAPSVFAMTSIGPTNR
jgi:hypothetical protein